MPAKFTPSMITKLESRQKEYIIGDSVTPGLCIRVKPNGSKRYYFKFRDFNSRQVIKEPIGSTENITLPDARKIVKMKAGQLASGIDIRAERKHAEEDAKKPSKDDFRLFNYIDKFYEPYAIKHSVTAKEIIRALKKNFAQIKNKLIYEIDTDDIDAWRQWKSKEVTFSRLRRIFTYLKVCLNTAVKHYKLIETYPLINYNLERRLNERINPPKVRYLLREEEARLLFALAKRDQKLRNARNRHLEWQSKRNHNKNELPSLGKKDFPDHITPIVIIAYNTGFDLSDIFDFEWREHIDFENRQIRKVRNKISHKVDDAEPVVVKMSTIVYEVLEQWSKQHGREGLVFKSPNTGKRIVDIKKAWRSVLESADIKDFRFKDLRHTFASYLAIAGEELLTIRDLMGHMDIKTTQIYAHLCINQKRLAVDNVFG